MCTKLSHNEFHIPGPVVEFRRPPSDSEADVSLCLAFEKLARAQVEVRSEVSPMTRMTGRGRPGIAAVHAAQPDHATSTSVGSIGGNVVDGQQEGVILPWRRFRVSCCEGLLG